MPSESKAQHNFFEAVKHNKRFAEKAGVSQDVASEYVEADKHSDQWKQQDHVPKQDGK
jgi:hypothetical protein